MNTYLIYKTSENKTVMEIKLKNDDVKNKRRISARCFSYISIRPTRVINAF